MPNKTLTPAIEPVPAQVNSDELERAVLQVWAEGKIFERTVAERAGSESFTFYDGPPYATGKPHYGHILQSTIKDTVLRYKTMQGYNVSRRVGWDCHGLPVETIVEQALGFKSKKDIEAYGIEAFNQKCRETVMHYVDEFTAILKRIGRWAEYESGYFTLNREYMESEWWVFKQLWDQELVYRDFRSTPYCIRCETPLSNFEVSFSYREKVDQAVYVKLPLTQPASLAGVSLLIWTTTPWTLPANVAVAFHPDITYVIAEYNGAQYLLAQERVGAVLGPDAKVIRTVPVAELQSITYRALYPDVVVAEEVSSAHLFTLVPAEHVTATDGTGLVHVAPAFGEEDALVGRRHGLPVIKTINRDGTFTSSVKTWAGQQLFAANEQITADLKQRQLLVRDEQYRHSYPFCWRCDTPLIYYALDTWFVKVTALKEQLLQNNEAIHWIPEHVKHGRFGKGIESAPDWAVSRNRYWSVPMPVWECDICQHRTCIGSVSELSSLAGVADIPDLHRPYVDDISWRCTACPGTMRRIPEVLDVWFDSGSMPYAQWHYPFEHKESVEQSFPADFIVEAIEMTRAWFYVLHVLAGALTQRDVGLGQHQPAFRHSIASGIIFAEDGRKLSKKLKNYPELEPTIATYGADAMRFYFLSSSSLGEPYRFSEKDLKKLRQNTYVMLWNAYSFFTRYAATHGWTPGERQVSTHLLDRWLLARYRQLEHEVITAADAYEIDRAARAFITYLDDVSNWYVRRSRQRFQKPASTADRNAAFTTLYDTLVNTSRLLAPFMPFLTDAMFRHLTGHASVHLERLPRVADLAPLPTDDEGILTSMQQARAVVSTALALRAAAGIKVRQPLMELIIAPTGAPLPDELLAIIRDEVNVKTVTQQELPTTPDVRVSAPEDRVQIALRVTLTDELRREGLARDIIRHGQLLRRQAKYALNDRITLVYRTQSAELQQVLQEQHTLITSALQADQVNETAATEDASSELTLADSTLHLGVSKGI